MRQEDREGRVLGQAELPRQVELALLALQPRGGDVFDLRVDGLDALDQILRLAAHDHFLLLVEQGEHFAVFLQFFAERVNEVVQEVFHGCWLAVD